VDDYEPNENANFGTSVVSIRPKNAFPVPFGPADITNAAGTKACFVENRSIFCHGGYYTNIKYRDVVEHVTERRILTVLGMVHV